MTPELIGEAIVDLMVLVGFLMVIGVGTLIADYIFPSIPFIQRYLDSLPDYEDNEELYQQEMARIRRRRNGQRNMRRKAR